MIATTSSYIPWQAMTKPGYKSMVPRVGTNHSVLLCLHFVFQINKIKKKKYIHRYIYQVRMKIILQRTIVRSKIASLGT